MLQLRARACWIALIGLLGLPGSAYAQTNAENAATAEALFREAKALLEKGSTAQACDKFAASQKLDPALGTLINLADCHERVGRTASAWAEFLQVAQQARRTGQTDRATVAEKRAAALEPKLTRLTIVVPPATRIDGLEIRRGDVVVDPATWNTASPVDPGQHTISAKAPKKLDWSQPVEVVGDGKSISITIPALDDAPVVAPVPPPPAATTPAPVPTQAPAPPQDTGSTQRMIGLIVGGVGIVGVGIGSYFGLSARSKWNDAGCTNAVCATRARQTLAEDAKSQAGISTVAMVGGGVLVGAGALLFLTALPPSQSTTSARAPHRSFAVSPAAGPDSASLTLHGSF